VKSMSTRTRIRCADDGRVVVGTRVAFATPMHRVTANRVESSEETRKIAIGYARGLMGGLLVGTPVMMTMEMWWEGFFVPAWRLVLLYCVNYGVLLVLQHYSGLTHKKTFRAQASAALVAYGIGIVASLIALFALGVLHGELQIRDLAGKLVLQSVPVSIGASVAMSEFGEAHRVAEERRERAGYGGTLGMALAGAMLFGFGISGTEEPLMIAEQLTDVRGIILVFLSVAQVYAIVYAVDFKKKPEDVGTRRHTLEVLREGVSTYALALVMGAYLLWTFRTIDSGMGIVPAAYAIVALGFVTSLGAAAAELLI
jgi:putative integral membrane protein (TIGR02587 family)